MQLHWHQGLGGPSILLVRGRRYGRAVTIATRGCVHRCGYCSIPFLYGRGQRRRPVGEVAREVALMPGKSVVFWDDYLMADRAYALALCAIAPYRKWWTTQTTMRVAFDEELMAVAAESGCKAVFVGLETVSQRSLEQPDRHRILYPTLGCTGLRKCFGTIALATAMLYTRRTPFLTWCD